MITENLPALFADLGVTATCDGVSAVVMYDAPGAAMLDGMIADDAPQLLVPSQSWPAARAGSAIVVGGVSYTAREVTAQDDGALLYIRLRRAA